MGYNTTFYITITAATAARRLSIVQKILALSHISAVDVKDCLAEYQLKAEKEVYEVSFNAKWYQWHQDIQTSSYDACIRVTDYELILHEYESLKISGFGEQDDDVWRAFVTKRKFLREYCAFFNWINNEAECINSEQDEICSGCQSCAERDPIFD